MSTIGVVTAWWNEFTLAPLFMRHYWYAKQIVILYDLDSDPRFATLVDGLADKRGNVSIVPISYPRGIDWRMKSERVNSLALDLPTDWAFVVDADEFIFPRDPRRDPREYLREIQGDVLRARFFTVYQNENDVQISTDFPPIPQRLHGPAKAGFSYGVQAQGLYLKPCIFRPESEIRLSSGAHFYTPKPGVKEAPFQWFWGAHWAMASPELALERRLGQKRRQSPENIARAEGFQNHWVDQKEILRECDRHWHDAVIPELAQWSDAAYSEER